MSYSMDTYRHRLPEIKSFCDSRLEMGEDKDKLHQLLCLYTGIPIIVCCHFIGELYGYSDKLNKSISNIMKFYGYKEIGGLTSKKDDDTV